MSKYVLRIGVLLFAATGLVGLTAAAASACNPGRPHNSSYDYFVEDGTGPTWDNGHCINGVFSPLIVRNPYVQTGDSTAYAMIENPIAYSGKGEAAQTGIRNVTPNYTRQNFAEWVQGSTIKQLKTWSPAAVGSEQSYQVTYSASAFHIQYNGINEYDWTDSTYSGCWAAVAGEIHDTNTQMPGVQVTHEIFGGPVTESNDGNGWEELPYSNWTHGPSTDGGYSLPPSPDAVCQGTNCATTLSLNNGANFGWSNSSSGGDIADVEAWDMCQYVP